MTTYETGPAKPPPGARIVHAAIWLPGLGVALGAAVATAHGLYEVAVAARVPAGIAWLYPLITDGLALVAYTATTRLTGPGRRYAWAVVLVAAGLSGLAQAAYLASDGAELAVPVGPPATGFVAPAPLRFGVGAWPAIAAAIVAHLLYLLATDNAERPGRSDRPTVQPYSGSPAEPSVNGHRPAPSMFRPTGCTPPAAGASDAPFTRPLPSKAPTSIRALDAPARNKARAAARRYADQHGAWPTVTQLMSLAEVSRGTAGEALRHLRGQAPGRHQATERSDQETES